MVDIATTSKELLAQQLEEATSRKKNPAKPKPIDAPKGVGVAYNSQLQKLANAVRKDINQNIVPLAKMLEPEYVTDSAPTIDGWADDMIMAFAALRQKWSSPAFISAANQTATTFINGVDGANQKRFERNMNAIGLNLYGDSAEMNSLLQASIADNTRLIVSIPSQYLGQVESIVFTNMRAGLLVRNLIPQLQNQFGVTKNRARLIARDQTTKANGEISKQRQTGAGFEYFQWLTSKDSRVRDEHQHIANDDVGFGKGIYRWDDPPTDEKGVKIVPSSPIQCRCVAIPITNQQVAINKNQS